MINQVNHRHRLRSTWRYECFEAARMDCWWQWWG